MTTITEKLAEKKGWRREGKHWVSGPEQMPSIEKTCADYRPTEDFKQACAELNEDILCFFNSKERIWHVYKYTVDFIADEHIGMYVSADAEDNSLPMALCEMLLEREG